MWNKTIYQKTGNRDFSFKIKEAKCPLGVLILSGYNNLPLQRMYREQQYDRYC